ncbi:MAG: hypothetical protein J0665_21065 [Deltaproteobacteria bacterium]|nr:hypothetical protein [Deltaproteobacteria bacterium]
MGKKEKAAFALAEDLQAVIAMVPRLSNLIKVHKEIAAGYQKYRKNGGEAIPGIEKHLGVKEQASPVPPKKKKAVMVKEVKAPEEGAEAEKTKKKVKK